MGCESQLFVETADGALRVQDDLVHTLLLAVFDEESNEPPAKPSALPLLEDGDALEPRPPFVIPDTSAPDGLVPEQDDDVLRRVIQPVQLPLERNALALDEHLPTDGEDRVELVLVLHEANLKLVHCGEGGGGSL